MVTIDSSYTLVLLVILCRFMTCQVEFVSNVLNATTTKYKKTWCKMQHICYYQVLLVFVKLWSKGDSLFMLLCLSSDKLRHTQKKRGLLWIPGLSLLPFIGCLPPLVVYDFSLTLYLSLWSYRGRRFSFGNGSQGNNIPMSSLALSLTLHMQCWACFLS